MKCLTIVILTATGLAWAQIQPGTAAYDAVSSIANNQYLNAVNVSCGQLSTTPGAMCFETEVSDQAFARQLVDDAMQGYKPIAFWTRDSAGTETKSWSLSENGGTLSVKIMPGPNVELLISSDEATSPQSNHAPLGTTPPPQNASLQQVALDALAEVEQRTDVSRYDCPSGVMNAVCFETTASLSDLKSTLDSTFANTLATSWQTSYTPSQTFVTATYGYEGAHLFVVGMSHGVALTSACVIEAIY